MTPSQLIAMLNAMTCGDVDSLAAKLTEARESCVDLSCPDLAELLEEARTALQGADLKTYRKRIETVVARLGHLRARPGAAQSTAGNRPAG